MAFKDILLSLTAYPNPTLVSATDEPIAFAAAMGARISAIACEVKFLVPGSMLGRSRIALQPFPPMGGVHIDPPPVGHVNLAAGNPLALLV